MNNSKQDYKPNEIEPMWQQIWDKNGIYSPNLDKVKRPFYNLMMFPYPSAEGMHVGNMYAFTGADVYGRFKRMQGFDVFEPIGLDGFGIHSENYAIKIGRHPKEQAKISEKNFYRQLRATGNGFDWSRKVETYDPKYYKWTQWLFIQLFKAGLAYRAKAKVNWCPSCKTVLADEQVINKIKNQISNIKNTHSTSSGQADQKSKISVNPRSDQRKSAREIVKEITVNVCERCGTEVFKKDLEQWFFRITKYADRLLNNIDKLDWSEKVKIAQRQWIGRSEGAQVTFSIKGKYHFVLLHGFTGNPEANFFLWLKRELEKRGHTVEAPLLPNTNNPDINGQARFVLNNCHFNSNTIVLGHSLGSVVAAKVCETLNAPIKKLVLAAGFLQPKFLDKKRPFEKTFTWEFDFSKIKKNTSEIVILRATNDTAVPQERSDYIQSVLGGNIIDFEAEDDHISGEKEPVVMTNILPSISVFTTRPDTLYGATFLVLSPEHPTVGVILNSFQNLGSNEIPKQVRDDIIEYVEQAKKKTEQERMAEEKEKTGVFSGLYAINPLNQERLPVWIADYVLMGYGTGAIMGVPAHDERDFEFANKYNLSIRQVVIPTKKSAFADALVSQTDLLDDRLDNLEKNITQNDEFVKGVDLPKSAYTGFGILVNSGKYTGLSSKVATEKMIKDFESLRIMRKEVSYHLRDWLISRQRYWGPPIPMVYCSKCAGEGKSWFSEHSENSVSQKVRLSDESDNLKLRPSESSEFSEMRGWYPDENLPVLLPDVKDWKPLGKGNSPLANHPEFYKVACPNCGAEAKRETDISDNFLDSSWYFLRYLGTEFDDVPFPSKAFISEDSENSAGQNIRESDRSDSLKHRRTESSEFSEIEKRVRWLPVMMYIGGAEHSVLHLLYSRFITMVLHDLGYISFQEPFSRFFAHGLLIKEGAKMSKSKGNVVVPDQYIAKFGADTLRMYLMFLGPFNQGGDFYDTALEGMHRFVKRVWYLVISHLSLVNRETKDQRPKTRDQLRMMHKTIKKVTEDISSLRYNTAIASLMTYYNFLSKQKDISQEEIETYLKLLAPFAPHMAEELWQRFRLSVFGSQLSEFGLSVSQSPGQQTTGKQQTENRQQRTDNWSIHLQLWPKYDPKFLEEDEVTIVVQVDGKVRETLKYQKSNIKNQKYVEDVARESKRIRKYIEGKKIKKVVYVEGKVINFVTD